jgi:heme/copper-type cytochrome/quinol oxidase subunit 4
LQSTSGVGLAIVMVVVPFWMVLHSYLIALRFSTIDIMRNAVSE